LLGQEQGKITPWFGSYTIYYLLLLFFTVSNVPLIVQHYDIMFHNLIFIFISFEQALYYTGEACNSSTGTKTQKNYLYVVLHHQIAPVTGNYQRFATAGVTRIHINLAISQVIRKQQY